MRTLSTLLAGCAVGAVLIGAAAAHAAPLAAGAVNAQTGVGLDQTAQGMTGTTARPKGPTASVTANSAASAGQDTSATVSGPVNPRSATDPPTSDAEVERAAPTPFRKGGPVNPKP